MKLCLAVIIAIALASPSLAADPPEVHAKAVNSILKVKEGDKITDFECTDVTGVTVKTSEIRKGKPILISFVRDPGREADNTRQINAFVEKHPHDVVVIEVAIKDKLTDKEILGHYEKSGPMFMPVFDFDGKIAEMYGVTATPVALVIDTNGYINCIIKGLPHPQIFSNVVEKGIITRVLR